MITPLGVVPFMLNTKACAAPRSTGVLPPAPQRKSTGGWVCTPVVRLDTPHIDSTIWFEAAGSVGLTDQSSSVAVAEIWPVGLLESYALIGTIEPVPTVPPAFAVRMAMI